MKTLLWHAIVGVLIFPIVFSMKNSAPVVDQSDLHEGNFCIPSQKYIFRFLSEYAVRYCNIVFLSVNFNSIAVEYDMKKLMEDVKKEIENELKEKTSNGATTQRYAGKKSTPL